MCAIEHRAPKDAPPSAETPCAGAVLGYRVDLKRAAIARARLLHEPLREPDLEARVHGADLGAQAGHGWDLPG
jgi:hypothetical protein